MVSIVRGILDYQFGSRVGTQICRDYEIKIEYSKRTGRARRIYIDKKLFGTIEPTTGFIIPTYFGASIIKNYLTFPKYRVVVSDEAVQFVSKGKTVFNKFVSFCYEEVLPYDVVLVVDKKDNLLAVGISQLSAREMLEFDIGVAVKVKHAREDNKSKR